MKILRTTIAALFLALALFAPCRASAQPNPGGGGNDGFLDSWLFSSTNWQSGLRYAPLSFTNLALVTNVVHGNSLLLDTTNGDPASLVYNTIESDGTTNLNCPVGTISTWISPDWSGTNAGGSGSGEWSRLFEVGTYTTNASTGWLSLYLSPDGSTIYFGGQTNTGYGATFLSAPITLTSNTWCNLVLTYGPTNSALYFNGQLLTNGGGVTYYPGPAVRTNGFSIGSSAADGHSQIHGELGYFATYNYQWDSGSVYLMYAMYSVSSFGGQAAPDSLINGPSSPAMVPTFDAVTGPGILTFVSSNTSGCVTSSNFWMTNLTATPTTNQTINVSFTIAGGSNDTPYDVFATAALANPMTNATWVWLGQGYHCSTYSLAIQSNTVAFFILGGPQDSDGDGLTDAYEMLVSKTNPYNADTSGDGMLDGWKVLWGMNPRINNPAQSGNRANYTFDGVGRLQTQSGILSEIFTFDAEGNIGLDEQ